jgi:Holliday junction resolvasome RuvABC ATP-dependent DNA helicase subunit
MAREVAERAKVEAEERRKVQEAKDALERLQAEAEILEREDPESLTSRLHDFDDEPLNGEKIPVMTNKGSTRDPVPNPTKVCVPDANHQISEVR